MATAPKALKPEAKDKKPEAAPEPPSPVVVKPKRRKLIIVIAAVGTTLVLAAGGGAAWFLSRPKHPAEPSAAAAPAPKPKSDKPEQVIFVPLDTFTVNLQPESGDRYLQTSLSLKVAEPGVEQAVKQLMPEIRSKLLLLLSSKRASELTSVEGKQALANQIADQINRTLNPDAAPAPASKAPDPAAAPAAAKTTEGAVPAAAPPAAPAPQEPALDGPVLSVLFTNFIIQ